MTIDFLILILLLISFAINFLALGAFWMTPSLRTTAGRFVINLLIINLAGCCILASTLFFFGNTSATAHTHNSVNILDSFTKDITSNHHRQSKRTLNENGILNKIKQVQDIFNYNSEYFENLTIKDNLIKNNENRVNLTKNETSKIKSTQFMRLWSIDLAAALGGLSVLVVVGDTWMAVKDPMRYRRRVSKENAWIIIVLNWTLGILFGVMSAYWQLDFEEIGKKRNSFSEQMQVLSLTFNIIFSKTFAYVYFVVIILLPFGFVCGMYWRIFTEAKGLRMRSSIPSPLLKLRTNLSRKNLSNNSLRFVEIDTSRRSLHEEIAEPQSELHEEITVDVINPNQSLLRREESNKNYSLRPYVKRSSNDSIESDRFEAIRPIYSTPNLQKCNQGYGSFLYGFETTFNPCFMSYQALRIHDNHISPRSISYMTSIRQQLSSFLKHREESRAARISILVVLMFFVSYLPYGFLGLLHGSQMIKNCPYSTQLAVFMILLANLSSPFIFAYRNKRVRHGVTRLFGFDNHSKNHCQQIKCTILRFLTKFSMSIKRNSNKLLLRYSMNSCEYLSTPMHKHRSKSLQNIKYDMNTVEKYLTNSASIQSSTMFGNIIVFNADIDLEQAQENESIFKTLFHRSSNPKPIAV